MIKYKFLNILIVNKFFEIENHYKIEKYYDDKKLSSQLKKTFFKKKC